MKRPACFVFVLLACFAMRLRAQGATWPAPLQVRLDVPLQSYRARAGAPVLASVLAPWNGPGCVLKPGATVSGSVVAANAKKGQQAASMTVGFDRADCNGQRNVPIRLVLFALVNAVDENDFPRDASRLYGATSSRVGVGKFGAAVDSANMSNMADRAREEHGSLAVPLPKTMSRGEVLGAARVSMQYGAGAGGASVLQSSKGDFSIFAKAQLVLMAEVTTASAPRTSPEEARVAAPMVKDVPKPPPPVEPPDTTEVCSAGTCSEVGGDAETPVSPAAVRQVTLRKLGFRPRSFYELSGFDRDTTVHFLSPHQLLVTFDLHQLRMRTGEAWPPVVRRTIRATLLDAETGVVLKTVDWRVEGDRQYVWQVGERLLVHMGGALREVGPDLKSQFTIPACGDVFWVKASPSGNRIAVACLRERHTQQAHEQIQQLSSRYPEEDVVVSTFDGSGRLLGSRVGNSEEASPTLLDDGRELQVEHDGADRWRLALSGDGKEIDLVNVRSNCRPIVTMPSASAVFVAGCSPGRGRWYRMLDEKGRTFLKAPPSTARLQAYVRAIGTDAYAVGYVRMSVSTAPGATFLSSNIRDEQVAIYRAADGRLMTVANTRDNAQAEDGFAASPDGARLAVLTQAGVALYPVAKR